MVAMMPTPRGQSPRQGARYPGRGWALVGLGLLALLPVRVHAATLQVTAPPFVLLLTDTSERMNQVPGGVGLPVCPTEKSRYIHLQEALAGSLTNYSCSLQSTAIDGHGQVTRAVPTGTFGENGLLKQYESLVRFAWAPLDAVTSTALSEAGGFSYGDAPGSINLGARHPAASRGPLLSFAAFGAATDAAHNQQLALAVRGQQASPLPLIPYGATPSLAALLSDASFFFATDSSVLSVADGGADPLAGCRPKAAFLVAGGPSDPASDDLFASPSPPASPYQGADAQAATLLARFGVPTYVFYFADGNATTGERMNAIAAAGDTVAAFPVTNGDELRTAMNSVLNGLLVGIYSSTRTASTFQTFAPDVAQIQAAAAYTVPPAARWYGHLEYAFYRCNATQAYLVKDFGTELDRRTQSRHVLTPLQNVLRPLAYSASSPTTGLSATQLGLTGQESKAKELIDFLWGQSTASFVREHLLGAIVHASPQLMGPPMLELPFASYQSGSGNTPGFKTRYADRPTVAYVATSEGLLHAFTVAARGGTPAAATLGKEIFAFLPRSLQPTVRYLDDELYRNALLDGTPLVRDVRLRAVPDAPTQEKWITLLTAGAGNSGQFYYALNVTDPLAVANDPTGLTEGQPHWLWELADPQTLGYTSGRPAVGHLLLSEQGTVTEIAAVFLPGGKSSGVGNAGRYLYVVTAAPDPTVAGSPRILRLFGPSATATSDALTYPLVGTPVAYGTLPGQPTSRVFVGDAGGRLLRLDTSATDPSKWTLRVFYDPYTGQAESLRRPAFFEPSLSLNTVGDLVVIYGTGDPDNPYDSRGNHKLISLTETYSLTPGGTVQVTSGERPNFVLTFQTGEQLTGPPLIYDSTVYFPTYRHDGTNACKLGETRLWGVDYLGNDLLATTDIVRRFPTNTTSQLRGSGDGLWEESSPPSCDEDTGQLGSYAKEVLYCRMPAGTRIYGIEISRSPACEEYFDDSLLGDGTGGGLSPPVLTVQTGRYLPYGVLGLALQGRTNATKLRRLLNQPRVSTMPLMWGVIYDD